jgi:hypothetical protein
MVMIWELVRERRVKRNDFENSGSGGRGGVCHCVKGI